MGFLHNVFGDHDAEIQIVSDKANEAFGIATNVSSDVTNLSDRVTALSSKFTEFTNLSEKLPAPVELSDQALQAVETVVDPDKMMLICTVVSAAAVLIMASFIGFCIYQAIKHEREENQNLPPETGMSSSRTSSVSNLMQETQVHH